MKFVIKRQNGIISLVAGITLAFFAFSHIALASEINKDSIIQLVNKSRTEDNVEALSENENLDQVAKDKLDDMIKNNYFAHTSPSGITPWSWFEKNKYDYKYAGENLALGFSSVESEHQAWMNSPTHKKNILNPNYKEIGVAVGKGIIDNNLVILAVQEFGSRAESGVIKEEENNLSDDKSKKLLEENKKENKGIVLNTENYGSDNRGRNISGENKSGSKIDFSKFKDMLLQDRGFLGKLSWVSLIVILVMCITVNILITLMMAFHNLIIYLRKDQDIFKAVHGLLVLLLVGSIVFR
ncbi:MAG: CAP domain-containing protein [Parcubacteria group bacterium]|jgi:hypothetical protein